MMKLALFTKTVAHLDIEGLVDLGPRVGAEAFNLCVRDGNPVTPQNAPRELPRTAWRLAQSGLPVQYVTGPADLVDPSSSLAERIVGAAADAGIPLVKLGYFTFSPGGPHAYTELMDDIRRRLERWQRLGERNHVRLCYHTHGNAARHSYTIGGSAAELSRWMEHTDPRYIGMNLDPGCLLSQGEPFELAAAIAGERLAVVSLQDELYVRQPKGDDGGRVRRGTKAGRGCVCWAEVFDDLLGIGYGGPLVVHGEMPAEEGETREEALGTEIAYYKGKRDEAAKRSGA